MKKKIAPPRLSTIHLELADLSQLEDEILFSRQHIIEDDLSHQEFRGIVIEENKWEKVQFSQMAMPYFECADSIFEGCDFSNTEWIGGSFHRTVFKQCKLTGINFADSFLQDCTFIDCTLPYASFNFSQLKHVSFEQCDLSEVEFSEITWKHLSLNNCHINLSSWLNTSLTSLNLSSNTFEQIKFSPDKLQGLILNQEQMISIALGLGIRLDEPS